MSFKDTNLTYLSNAIQSKLFVSRSKRVAELLWYGIMKFYCNRSIIKVLLFCIIRNNPNE